MIRPYGALAFALAFGQSASTRTKRRNAALHLGQHLLQSGLWSGVHVLYHKQCISLDVAQCHLDQGDGEHATYLLRKVKCHVCIRLLVPS